MLRRIIIAGSLLLTMAWSSEPARGANGDKVLYLKAAPSEIAVDGIIEPDWSTADSACSFFQLQPYFNQPPTKKTVAKVLTSADALYCMIIGYDDRSNIVDNTGLLDQYTGDLVSIMLDTFNDHQTAYKFAVTASGVRGDARILDDARNRDDTWDGVWFGDAKIYDWGFVVEMKIPFKSIRYNRELTEWGVDFDRWVASNSEDLYWCRYEQNEGMRISKFGKLIFEGLRPTVTGTSLEIYPVGIARAEYESPGYEITPTAGIDIFYNPSEALTLQLTANPDFAQIEADPFDFNITRYESYFAERRPFFTEGNEIFAAAGRQYNSGFYRPLEFFYSRRIGRLLPGGVLVPLKLGTKGIGRIGEWEYGGFVALTGAADYAVNGEQLTEPTATFVSARLKRHILENSSIGGLFVSKTTSQGTEGVVDIDGAFRSANWQLAYQFARSFDTRGGDYAGSVGFRFSTETWITAVRAQAIGTGFEINQVGFVPWKGTAEMVALTGPLWYYDEGSIREMTVYAGPILYYEHADLFADRAALLGFNMNFRANWGYEINIDVGKAKDQGTAYTVFDASLSSWFNVSPKWEGDLLLGYSYTYNFSRDYVAPFYWAEGEFEWMGWTILVLGTSVGVFVEENPDNAIEDVTFNARPFFSLTPFNNLNIRVYVDNLYTRSSQRLVHVIGGLLFSYNFLPKSWIYFALNEVRDRSTEVNPAAGSMPSRLTVTDRAAVLKVKYLYYF